MSALTSATAGNARVALTWSTAAGAASYLIRNGIAPGRYDGEIFIGNFTAATVTGPENGVTHYFSIAAVNAAGIGLASNELGATPVAPGQLAAIAQRELTGMTGLQDAANVSRAPYLTSTFMNTSVLTRGGIAALQNTTTTVTLRIHVFGISQFAASGLGSPGDNVAIFGRYTNLPTALGAWRTLHDRAADGSQDLQTPAGDGVRSLLKFALNLAPLAGDLLRPAAQTLDNLDGTTLAERLTRFARLRIRTE